MLPVQTFLLQNWMKLFDIYPKPGNFFTGHYTLITPIDR